jgi:hypothetical protein
MFILRVNEELQKSKDSGICLNYDEIFDRRRAYIIDSAT